MSLACQLSRQLILFYVGFCVLLAACTSDEIKQLPLSDVTRTVSDDGAFIAGHIGGPTTSIHVQGNHAYLGHRSEFAILDISKPARPKRIGYLLLSTLDMVVEGEIAYVAGCDGLAIVDVSRPANPRVLGFMPTSHSAIGIAKTGGIAVLVVYKEGLHIINVSEPSKPRLASVVPMDSRVTDVALHGQYAYVVTNLSIQVVEVMDGTNPEFVGSLALDRPVFSLAIDEDVAYVGASGGILIVDIAQAANPVAIEWTPLEGTPLRLKICENALYSAAGNGLGIVYLTGADNYPVDNNVPSFQAAALAHSTDWFDLPGASWDVAAVDGYAFVADGDSGLRILRLDGPDGRETIGRYAVPDAMFSIAIDNNLAYVVDGQGMLWPVDVHRPTNPVTKDPWDTLDRIRSVTVAEGAVYLVSASDENRLLTRTTARRASCRHFGSLATEGRITDILASDNVAYLSLENVGLKSVDMRQPCHPRALNIFRVSEKISDIAVMDPYAYLAVENGRILVVNISDSESSREILDMNTSVGHLAIKEGFLYVAASAGSVTVLSVQPGSEPLAVATIQASASVHDMIIFGTQIYLGTSDGIQIYDVSQPQRPTLSHFVSVPGGAEDIEVVGGIVYASCGPNGMYIIQTNPDPNQRHAVSVLPQPMAHR